TVPSARCTRQDRSLTEAGGNTVSNPGDTDFISPSASSQSCGSALTGTHWPSGATPTATTFHARESIAPSTPPAVVHDTPCSEDRPPKSTTTVGRPIATRSPPCGAY